SSDIAAPALNEPLALLLRENRANLRKWDGEFESAFLRRRVVRTPVQTSKRRAPTSSTGSSRAPSPSLYRLSRPTNSPFDRYHRPRARGTPLSRGCGRSCLLCRAAPPWLVGRWSRDRQRSCRTDGVRGCFLSAGAAARDQKRP